MPRLLRRGGEPENARHFVKFISSFIFAAARSMILAWGEVKISTRKWREPVYTQFSQYFVWEAAFLFASLNDVFHWNEMLLGPNF